MHDAERTARMSRHRSPVLQRKNRTLGRKVKATSATSQKVQGGMDLMEQAFKNRVYFGCLIAGLRDSRTSRNLRRGINFATQPTPWCRIRWRVDRKRGSVGEALDLDKCYSRVSCKMFGLRPSWSRNGVVKKIRRGGQKTNKGWGRKNL